VSRLKASTRVVAAAVMRAAVEEALCKALTAKEIEQRLEAAHWEPAYPAYEPG
jgi:malic enzyme